MHFLHAYVSLSIMLGVLISRISDTIDKLMVRIQRTGTEVQMRTDALKIQRKMAGTKPKLSP